MYKSISGTNVITKKKLTQELSFSNFQFLILAKGCFTFNVNKTIKLLLSNSKKQK